MAYVLTVSDSDSVLNGYWESDALSRHEKRVDAIARAANLSTLHDWSSVSRDDATENLLQLSDLDELSSDLQAIVDNLPEERWFEASDGIRYVDDLSRAIGSSGRLASGAEILEELAGLRAALEMVAERELAWHLTTVF